MKTKLFTLILNAFIGLMAISACSDNDDDTEPITVAFTHFEVSDQENLNNSADIHLSYAIEGDITTVDELRLLISKSPLTQQEAVQIPSGNYQVSTISESLRALLDENLSDTDGDLITEGTNYNTYLLGVFQNDEIVPIFSASSSVMLSNETVVTTPQLNGSFNGSEDIAIGSDGTLYISGGQTAKNNLYEITPEEVSSVLNDTMNHPVGIALDDDGNIYTSNFESIIIKKTTPAGIATDFATDSQLVGGGGLVFDNDGNLFNTFFASTSIYRITEGNVEVFASSSSFSGPVGMSYDKERNNLYVANFNGGKIFLVSEDGAEITEVANTPATIGHLSYANDHFYITGWNEHKVYKISLEGEIIQTIGSGSNSQIDGSINVAAFSQPNGIEATSDGRYVYVTQGNGRLRKIVMPREN